MGSRMESRQLVMSSRSKQTVFAGCRVPGVVGGPGFPYQPLGKWPRAQPWTGRLSQDTCRPLIQWDFDMPEGEDYTMSWLQGGVTKKEHQGS